MATLLKFSLKYWRQIGVAAAIFLLSLLAYCEGYDAAAAKYTRKAFIAQQEAISRTKELHINLNDFKRKRHELESNDPTCKDLFAVDISHCLRRLR